MEDDVELEETQVTDEESATVGDEQDEAEVEEHEEATASEEGDAEGEEEPEEKPKRRNRKTADRRIRTLTAKNHELQRQLEAQATEQQPLTEPKEGDFEDYSDFVAAKATHATEKTLRKNESNNQQQAANFEQQERVANFNDGLDEAREKYEDFDEVWNNDTPVSQPMADAILESENAGEVAYYLGSHPKEATRISSMRSPMRQAAEIGKIEQKLSTPKPKRTTKAPPPITPLKGGGSVKKSVTEMTPGEMAKHLGLPG